jgi:glycosyltransferase involved in cell wall biosynthesis
MFEVKLTLECDLTLVIPFYNPGPRFASHIAEIIDVLKNEGILFQIIAVSDGSTDGSEVQLNLIAAKELTIIRNLDNQGKGEAIRIGLANGGGRYLGFIDADGDLPAKLLKGFVEVIKVNSPDIIYGSKRHPDSDIHYPIVRRLYSWGYQQLNKCLFGLPVKDSQTGVKIIRKDVLAEVLPRMVEKRFAFDLELFVVAGQRGFTDFVEMPVTIIERFSSTVSLGSVYQMFQDTFAIFYRLRIIHFYGPKVKRK